MMFSLLSKNRLSALFIFLSISANYLLEADCCCEQQACNRTYIGAFGGGLYSESTKVYQMGTAFFSEAEGGPLAVLAQGRTKSTSTGFGGVQVGYESFSQLGCSDWNFGIGGEVEAYWYSHSKRGHLFNDTDRLPEHDFLDSFKVNSSVILVNALLSINNSCFNWITPYVGGGIGATRLSLRKADSFQVDPPEEGINHFNSKRNDSAWAFAAQAKAGLRFNICDSFHVFGEYRFLFVDSSNYLFGSTAYSNHAATSPWNLKFGNTYYNAFTVGIQFDL